MVLKMIQWILDESVSEDYVSDFQAFDPVAIVPFDGVIEAVGQLACWQVNPLSKIN